MGLNRLQRGVRVTLIGLGVNSLLAMTKMAAGVFGHSHALVADAVESLADIVSSLIVWRGLVVAATPADADHPYGHGKAEPLAAATVALLLLLAAAWIVAQAVREVVQPHLAPEPYTLAVLVAVVVIKEALFRFVLREAGEVRSAAVRSDAWHHRSDAITSAAAFVGIGVALVGGPGYEAADDVAAIFAAGIIAWNGWRLLRPALDELMDAAPGPSTVEEVRAAAQQIAGVAAVEKCVVRKMGYHLYVDMHVEVDPQMPVERAHEISHQVKDRVLAEVSAVRDVLVHIEPQRRADAAPAAAGAGANTPGGSVPGRQV